MYLRLAIALLLASAVTASAQRSGGTAASQMAARANANASQALQGANGTPSLTSAETAPSDSEKPQRVLRSDLSGTQSDPEIHYPYGRYQPTLGNVSPASVGNVFTKPTVRGTPAAQTAPPSPFSANGPAFGISRAPAFSRGR